MAEEIVFNEDCCWTWMRQYCRGRGCPCGCHVPVADHKLEAYCTPENPCGMAHPCHKPGCILFPDQHPV